jgi:hypothetical protein
MQTTLDHIQIAKSCSYMYLSIKQAWNILFYFIMVVDIQNSVEWQFISVGQPSSTYQCSLVSIEYFRNLKAQNESERDDTWVLTRG